MYIQYGAMYSRGLSPQKANHISMLYTLFFTNVQRESTAVFGECTCFIQKVLIKC